MYILALRKWGVSSFGFANRRRRNKSKMTVSDSQMAHMQSKMPRQSRTIVGILTEFDIKTLLLLFTNEKRKGIS
jgi:hypothetical protein